MFICGSGLISQKHTRETIDLPSTPFPNNMFSSYSQDHFSTRIDTEKDYCNFTPELVHMCFSARFNKSNTLQRISLKNSRESEILSWNAE